MEINLTSAYEKILTIIILMAIGFFIKKKGILNDSVQSGIINLLIKVCIPFTIIHSFMDPFDIKKIKIVLLLIITAFLIYPVFQFIITPLLYKNIKEEDKKRTYRFSTTYPNAVFMGFPFIEALFGANGLFYAAVFNLPYNLYMWSIGFAEFTRQPMNKKGMKNTFLNPVFLSCIIGFALWLTQIFYPVTKIATLNPIWDTINLISAINTPLSMLMIGAMVADAKVLNVLKDKTVWYYLFNKLMFVPLMVAIILYLIGLRDWNLVIPVLIFAMPSCTTGAILSAQYNIKKEFMSSLVTLSTAFSAITITIWIIIILNLF